MDKLPKKRAKWLYKASLQAVFDSLQAAGGEVRVNGGAVRNALMGETVRDIDLSTTLPPQKTISALETAGIKAVPTGLEHGTITGVVDGDAFEITTLREDIETSGRHAVVKFGMDWEKDALRRDFTMNAIYCDRDGTIFDPINGMDDLKSRTIRFIGSPDERIEEDYLRILRFFRFFAWYGSGRPDAEGLKACAKLKHKLRNISVERIWVEFKKTLSAADPSRALLWMRTTGILTAILPESEKWGIDLIPSMLITESAYRWKIDPMLRLMAIIPPREEVVSQLAARLKFSGDDAQRLLRWSTTGKIPFGTEFTELDRLLYQNDHQAMLDVMRLEVTLLMSRSPDATKALAWQTTYLKQAEKWKRPVFPVKGKDLLKLGHKAGPEIGQMLKAQEQLWVDSGFTLKKGELLEGCGTEIKAT